MSPSTHLHWRRKLHAFLHDSPDKACNIASHELRAKLLKSLDCFIGTEEFNKSADHSASAADRIPFPHPNSSKLSQKLADLTEFNHPLGTAKWTKGWNFASENEAFEVSQKTRPFLLDTEDPRTAFICAWRFWRNWASDSDPRFTSLPADTRIPDHSIWHHMGVTSAFQGALATPEQKSAYPDEDLRPRLLLFSIGPVQDFIAAARSTRDLWSGSYLLSYLISTTLGTIAKEVGPDQVMFPNLLDQPLVDHHLCRGIFDGVKFGQESIAAGLGDTTDPQKLQKLLTPSLPNRFLALLPARMPVTDMPVDEYVGSLVEDLRNQLRDIARSVADTLENQPFRLLEFDRAGFDIQVSKLLEAHWQTMPIPKTMGELIGNEDALEKMLPPEDPTSEYTPRKAVRAILKMVEDTKKHRDARYFRKDDPTKRDELSQASVGWGLINALIAWLHDGTKAQRPFEAWRAGRWESGKAFNKDSLNGKEEAVLRVTQEEGTKEALRKFCCESLRMSQGTFKPGERLGASTLIKRLWHKSFLPGAGGLGVSETQLRAAMPMPNTHSIAAGNPFAQEADGSDEADGTDSTDKGKKYYAILALDGDEMGKWISGSKSPEMGHCLSPNAVDYYRKHSSDFLKAPRAVTPSWHLQFSEALGNFSLHAAQRVVEAFNGRLIYAGGDDVLAMLPATEALACARALRAAFRGEGALNTLAMGKLNGRSTQRRSDRTTQLFDMRLDGCLQLHPDSGAKSGDKAKLLSDPVKFPALVPGPAADVSVGIAIAHFKSPLQDVVKQAQIAERRAKRAVTDGGFGRAAVAVSLVKRSGEILEWGCKWSTPEEQDSAGYQLLHALTDALNRNHLNSRFPHKLEALLAPYLPGSSKMSDDASFEENFAQILARELDHCLGRNAGGKLDDSQRQLFTDYWLELCRPDPKDAGKAQAPFKLKLTRFINLLRTASWMKTEETTNDSPPAIKPQPALA